MQLRTILSFATFLIGTVGFGLTGCESDDALPRYRGAAMDELRLEADAVSEPGREERPQSLAERIAAIAREVREELGDSVLSEPAEGMRAMDTLVLRLSSRLLMISHPDTLLAKLRTIVFDEAGVAFDRDQDALQNMFPHSVLQRKRGSCLGMSLLLLVMARKMDMPVHGVVAPRHFFVRFDNGTVSRNIESIKQGACLSDDWYRERYGIDQDRPFYDLGNLSVDEVVGVLRFNVGNVYRDQAHFTAAVRSYEQAVSVLPEYAEAWGNLGIALEGQGELERALDALEKARQLDPSLKNLERNIGALRIRLAQHRKAIEDYRRALAEQPGNPDLLYGLAYAFYGAGEYQKAHRYAGMALEARESFADARELLQRSQDRLEGAHSES